MKQSVTITGENLNVVMNGVVAETAAPARMMSKAEMRIAALKAKGIDTSCYFPMGTDNVVKIEDGVAVPVEMMDYVEKKVVEGGYINHYTLFRRWVMSQMFRMLRKQEEQHTNFTELIQNHGYEYTWRVVERELNAQVKMLNHGDKENYLARNRWFNNNTVADMMESYISRLKYHVENNLMYRKNAKGDDVYKHTCKGNPYVRIGGKNVFVSDLEKKVYSPLRRLLREVSQTLDVAKAHAAIVKFNRLRKKMQRDTKMDSFFINAYKGSGAYFTCKNLILFHGATFRDGCKFLGQKKSLKYLEERANAYRTEGWRMMGVLKQLISDSGISIQGKIDEWKK